MTWLAPDVPQDLLGEPWFREAADNLGKGLSVHYSTNDTILTHLSRVANLSSRLGAAGPGSAEPHRKIDFVDMTAELGTEKVHTGYLLRDSASVRLIEARLKDAGKAM
jgi:hypothetical protein